MRRRNQSADERPLRPDAFIRQAMGAWGGSVWRLALAQTGSKEDAADVYQDVFLRLAQSATEFSSQEHLKAWLLRVAVNRCHDVARLRSRRPAVPLDSMRALWEAVGELPESMRVVIHLYYQEGYSGKEIAGLLGLEPSTVRTRLQRARAQLKISLGGVDYDQSEPVQSDDGPSGATCPSAG